MKRDLTQLLRAMLRIRMVEEFIAELYPQQEMRCPVHLCIGQEAVAVGVCSSLERTDYVLSGHRSHGHYLAKGGDLKAMMAELYGKATGCSRGNGGSMHLVDLAAGFLGAAPIVASTIPIAAGTAFGSTMRKEPRVTVVFFGDGACEEGTLHESLNFAALKKLPIVFVCENNLYSVYSPLKVRQPERYEIFRVAQAYGIASRKADGNDVVEVRRLAKHAVGMARRGGGPSFLEFATYRWREHCGPAYDNDLGYRSEEEFDQWRRRCPIEMMKARLLADGTLLEPAVDAMQSELRAEIAAAIEFARHSPFPDQRLMAENVYSP